MGLAYFPGGLQCFVQGFTNSSTHAELGGGCFESRAIEGRAESRLQKATPIQMAAIPIGLQQRDVIGVAETGSGKTAASVLPMLTYISKLPPMTEEIEAEGPYAVVMAPTRELAQQIEDETVKFAHFLDIRVVSVVGGQSIEEQDFKLRQELDAQRIYRTTYMFSATMPPAVERLARKYLRNPVVVTIGTAGKATDLITQHVYMVKETEKLDRLCRVLSEMGEKTAIIFVNTKKNADSLSRQLDENGYRVTTLHGGKTQEQREVSLDGFRNKRFNCLVATDVAGRGIDIPDVAHVINYDMPAQIEMYTHRIGRTGRAGKTGVATTFLTHYDSDVFYDFKQVSALGLGCMGLSQWYGKALEEKEGIAVIHHVYNNGVTFFETSDADGLHTNETLLGMALKTLPRETVQVATKFAFTVVDGKMVVKGTHAYVRNACEDSLKRLDYVDLYYQHRVDTNVPIEVTMGELRKLVEEGKVKYIGLSE